MEIKTSTNENIITDMNKVLNIMNVISYLKAS